jgi:CRP-like cAMP-binding protein
MFPQNANRLLASLSSGARQSLLARSTSVQLPVKTPLFRTEQTPSYVYFVTAGMASIVSSMRDGGTAEVGIVGFEGFVGSLHLLGPAVVHTQAMMQLEGTAIKVPFADARKAFRDSEEIRDRILEYQQEQALVVTQLAACNRLHEAEERLARWLLMAQDCTGEQVLPFTQEFLGMMLGARRSTVTLVAGALQKADLIDYSRGKVTIKHRSNLEHTACDCYPIIKNLTSNLYR